MEQTSTIKKERQKKFLLILPVIVIPFVTIIFWSLGGGSGKQDELIAQNTQEVLKQLPDANIPENDADKMSYYDQAERDSAKRLEMLKNDPNYRGEIENDWENEDTFNYNGISEADYAQIYNSYNRKKSADPREEKIYRRLDELNRAINSPGNQSYLDQNISAHQTPGSLVTSSDIDRLQQTIMQTQTLESSGDNADPEMAQLNTMLDKVLDIQHPTRIAERLQKESEKKKGVAFPVATQPNELASTVLQANFNDQNLSNGFYSFDETKVMTQINNAISATVYETQTLTSGSTVKMELVNDIYINGTLIPRNSFVFGLANLEGERLTIKINSIKYKNSLFPVRLSVYDMDGLEGIYVPGAITREVSKESADRALQGISISALDPSLTAQAASAAATAGVETVKTILSKKVKLIKATVKAGYRILLLDENHKSGE